MTELIVKRRRLHPGQVRLDLSPARFKVAMFGRRWGKNVYGIDRAMRHALAGKAVGWFEPTYKYVLEAWRDLVNRLQPVTKHLSEQDKRLELITGGVIEMWSADTPDAGRGRSYDDVIINEAGIIRGLMMLWQAAIRPTLTDRIGSALFLGTPKGRTHDFSLLHAKAASEPEWESFRGPTSENPFIPKEEIEAARHELPPQVFAQEFEGIPADDGANPFGLEAIAACSVSVELWNVMVKRLHPVCFGWDFARARDWTVGIGMDEYGHVVRFHRWQLVPWGETKRDIAKYTDRFPAAGDSTGLGDPIVEDLQRVGCLIQPVQFTGSHRSQQTGAITAGSKQKLMERLAGVIQEQKIRFPDGPIRAELETFGYEYTANGVRYEAAAGLHDDCVMALALAVYMRDRVGPWLEKPPEKPEDFDRHPGMDAKTKRRKMKRYETAVRQVYEDQYEKGYRMPRQEELVKVDKEY